MDFRIPWGAAAIGIVLAGHHSDVTGERRWHLTLAGVLGAAAFAVSSIPGISGTAGLAALTIAAIGTECALCLFWTLPTGILSGDAAAAGIALDQFDRKSFRIRQPLFNRHHQRPYA